MKEIHENLPYRELCFLIKQEVVYLEKEILETINNKNSFYLTFVSKKEWDVQTSADTFSKDVLSEMLRFLDGIKRNGNKCHGTISARFFDTNVLSVLFTGCEESDADNFCRSIQSEAVCYRPSQFDFKYIGDELYKVAYRGKVATETKKRKLNVGLSYQQNYLVNVVSRDRNEPVETLLSEAVNQAIFKYHQVIRNE